MKRNSKLVIGAVIGALTLGGVAMARGPHGPMGHMAHLMQELDLSDEQQAMAEDMKDRASAWHQEMREEREALGQEFLAELETPEPDRERIHALLDEGMDSLRAGMHDRIDDLLDLHATLTEDQRAALLAEIEEAKERRGERGHPPGPHERGPELDKDMK